MNVLFFDATQDWIFIGIYEISDLKEIKVLSEFLSTTEKESSFKLVLYIQKELEKIQISAPEVIVVANGPGSFTGIRLTVSTARNLAQLWKIPVLGIDSLQSYYSAISQLPDGNILLAIDGKQNKYYCKASNGTSFSETYDLTAEEIEFQKNFSIISPNARYFVGKNLPLALKNWYHFPIEELQYSQVIKSNMHLITSLSITTDSYESLVPNYIRGTYVD